MKKYRLIKCPNCENGCGICKGNKVKSPIKEDMKFQRRKELRGLRNKIDPSFSDTLRAVRLILRTPEAVDIRDWSENIMKRVNKSKLKL